MSQTRIRRRLTGKFGRLSRWGRDGGQVEKVTANLLAEHLEHNRTAPGYRRRTVKVKELRRLARRMIEAATAGPPSGPRVDMNATYTA